MAPSPGTRLALHDLVPLLRLAQHRRGGLHDGALLHRTRLQPRDGKASAGVQPVVLPSCCAGPDDAGSGVGAVALGRPAPHGPSCCAGPDDAGSGVGVALLDAPHVTRTSFFFPGYRYDPPWLRLVQLCIQLYTWLYSCTTVLLKVLFKKYLRSEYSYKVVSGHVTFKWSSVY